MAGTPTTNYKIPTYASSDAPDLTSSYNSAMATIDMQMKKNADAALNAQTTANTNNGLISALQTKVAALETGGFAPSTSDKTVTVSQIANAKITSNGIIYFTA